MWPEATNKKKNNKKKTTNLFWAAPTTEGAKTNLAVGKK